ncbi:TetR/AcrR family transcriptional regulator [Mycetocola saprophilus]|uniref:TetR/AcrR family transcriptional regulator n=1 Tax=Mycetocola saprophilus TaxID=76636 RepID=UPI0009DEF96B|nr:TetR/AcrR family transcriptional regulator [Mycetocola saprophilus]
MASSSTAAGRAGRPRARAEGTASTLSAREQILDAAAALFVESGFSGASTRAIAERVGIRQQSLYYHFAGKDEILAELLSGSVRPSIDFIEDMRTRSVGGTSPAGMLFALATVDTRTLRAAPHNIGTLYLLPEIQDPRYEHFRAQRVRLRGIYGELGLAAATPGVAAALGEERIGLLLIQLAETVIQLRRDPNPGTALDDEMIATSCLRILGLGDPEIAAARSEAHEILTVQESGQEPASRS